MRRCPAGERRGVALLVHAMMADSGYLAPMAGALAAAGIDTFTVDLRGHGRSIPPSPRHACWGFDAYVRRDLPAAIEAVAAAAGVHAGEISYLGHSLGGMVGVAAFAEGTAPAPRRLVLVASSPWHRGGARKLAIALALSAAARPLGYLPARALGLGNCDENHVYIDEFVGWVRSRRWPWDEAARRLACPTLVVASHRDPYCRVEDARAMPMGTDVTALTVDTPGHFGIFRRGNEAAWAPIAAFMSP